jgi:hypothetical protein
VIEKSTKRKIIAGLHTLAFIMLALIAALPSQFFSIAWFSTNAGNEYYVTFARESMTTHATATTPGGFTVKKYEHVTPPQT